MMGRPPKPSIFSYQDIEQRLREANELARPPYIPVREELLGYIIMSLTERISWMAPNKVSPTEHALWRLIDVPCPPERDRLVAIMGAMLNRMKDADQNEYDHCRNQIFHIAMLEGLNYSPEQKVEIERCLKEIASEKASRLTHIPDVLALQRAMLTGFLMSEKFAAAQNQRKWIRAHWDRIITLIVGLSCRCNYDVSIENLFVKIEKYPPFPTTATSAAHMILAALHNNKPEFMRKQAEQGSI